MENQAKSVFSILPEQASSLAHEVDVLYLFITGVSIILTFAVAFLIIFFALKYRRRSEDEVPTPPHADNRLEIAGAAFLFVLLMVMFGWGARLFFKRYSPPADSLELFVTGKQWMWKVQHPEGKREINELHVPIDTPVKLTMSSEDVIHSFFVPAFRVKQDVVPGKYTYLWFKPNKLGKYHLFCAEYCGTQHSQMGGWVYVMTPQEYDAWLRDGGRAGGAAAQQQETPAQAGERVYTELGCNACHSAGPGQLGPSLVGLYGDETVLADDTTVKVDDNYLRESIMNSQAKLVKGYQPVMPLFKGLVNDEQLTQLIAYIKSLSNTQSTGGEG